MRDAFGGTSMLYTIIIFLVLYITFVAVALNYAKAFRVKNKIIDIIEQNEGIRDTEFSNTSNDSVIGNINDYLKRVAYHVENIDTNKYGVNAGEQGGCFDKGYCIVRYKSGDNSAEYYKVTTFVNIEFPFLGLRFTIPIYGETRRIERINRK